ncbi:MAG TPA: GGDEF domain-containing protein [Persephonella sp.]|uniref:Ggdef family protein n=1 Tax=Persephonella marina (strain DSM 14350 / EX-H1) TaxID=123214 RepID=C0QQF8_PERMH|nr:MULTISPECIES: EAL domain-containing protein [Persephonella]ACO03466.1 ggdef family protein [Persephonella marina EX-H1]HCB69490.1 GGDEF domain-containing protein [Persephonella sp.]
MDNRDRDDLIEKTIVISPQRVIELKDLLFVCDRNESCVLYSEDRYITDRDIEEIYILDSSGNKFKLIDLVNELIEREEDLYSYDFSLVSGDESIPVYLSVSTVHLKDGYKGAVVTVRDITSLRKTEEKLNLYEKIFHEAQDGIAVIDSKGRYVIQNVSHRNLTGYSDEEIIGKTPAISIGEKKLKQIIRKVNEQGKFRGIVDLKRKDGTVLNIDLSVFPVKDRKGKTIYYVGIKRDITEIIKREKELENLNRKLEKQLFTDSLTSLPNRLKLIEDIKGSSDPKLAIFNINSFKEINDFYGQEIGDELLKKVGRKINSYVDKDRYTVYKLSGDEFAILSDRDITMDQFSNTIQRIIENIHEEIFICGETEIHIYMTAGYASGKERLISRADMALKYAKQHKKSIQLYSKNLGIEKQYIHNITVMKKIKEALRKNMVTVHFQPVYNNRTGLVESYETLVRLKDTDGSEILPETFFDIAKKSPVYPEITAKIIETIFKKIKDIPHKFSLNLSVRDIENRELTERIFEFLKSYRNDIIFEILESESIRNYRTVSQFIKEVKKLGAQIAIDDFGSGYSNFEFILKLDVDYIKLDSSLIKDIDRNINSQIIVETIVGFAKRLGKKTVAEHVHSEEVFEVVKELDVDFSQGFYFGKPSPNILI